MGPLNPSGFDLHGMIYWYEPADYWMFVDFNQRVNMEILKRFNKEGVDFAFPAQTIHLASDSKRQRAMPVLETTGWLVVNGLNAKCGKRLKHTMLFVNRISPSYGGAEDERSAPPGACGRNTMGEHKIGLR